MRVPRISLGKFFNVLLSAIGRMASWPMRNIETFPSNQMYLCLSLIERKVAEFYLNDLFSLLFPDNWWCPCWTVGVLDGVLEWTRLEMIIFFNRKRVKRRSNQELRTINQQYVDKQNIWKKILYFGLFLYSDKAIRIVVSSWRIRRSDDVHYDYQKVFN